MVHHHRPRDGGAARRGRARGSPGCRQGGRRPLAAPSAASWGTLPGRERAKYLFRIARILQERSREFAVLETLDGGKPIKESRDVDVPLAAAHFWYYAGWADKLEYAVPGRTAPSRWASRRRSSPGTSRCSCWPGRSRRRSPPATRSCSSRPAPRRSRPSSSPTSAARRTCLPASSTSSPGPGEIGLALVKHPDVDKVAFTGSTAVGKLDRPCGRRHGQGPHPGARRQGRQHRLRRRAHRPGHRGRRQRHLLQPGRGLLRGQPPARPGIDRRALRRAAQGPAVDACAWATRWTRTPTWAPSTTRRSWPRSRSSSRLGWPRARSSTSPPASCPPAASSCGRRCSRTWPSRTASRRRRSSARSSPC